jgi:U3 small nucleolar RNA-associated protein MPP10
VRIKKIKARGKNLPLSGMLQLGKKGDDEDGDEDSGIAPASSSDEPTESSGDDDEDDDDMKGIEADDSDDTDEDASSDIESESFDQREAIERLKDDLFADDDEEKDNLGECSFEYDAYYSFRISA